MLNWFTGNYVAIRNSKCQQSLHTLENSLLKLGLNSKILLWLGGAAEEWYCTQY